MNGSASFAELNILYEKGDFSGILNFENGLRFLKLRSMSRMGILKKFCTEHGISNKPSIKTIFDERVVESDLEDFIQKEYDSNLNDRNAQKIKLYKELYKMNSFDWGGLYQNGLEITIVNNYVKKIINYDTLNEKIEDELHNSMRGYVRSSWYNNWTTILIEEMFKENEGVLPAIGKVKHLDFFWKNIPLDLKVTHLPSTFLNSSRKYMNIKTELQSLKNFAKEEGIDYDKKSTAREIFNELYKRISESQTTNAQNFIRELKKIRADILSDAMKNPIKLAKWLYENQGVRRFDRVYRFYVILVDSDDFESSWKLKRNNDLVPDKIRKFLTKDPEKEIMNISFEWVGKKYDTKCFLLFIVKGQ